MLSSLSHDILYIMLFIGLYFEVFVLITYLEYKDDILEETATKYRNPAYYPTVSIIVPVWNEEKTLVRTIDSLLKLDYPKDKFEILIVDDGSTDGTFALMQTLTTDSRIRIFHKENGGKHTALNFGLKQSVSELVGCLDADSYVDSQALKNIVCTFESDPEIMAVTPSVKIWQPKGIIQMIQSVEYIWAIFLRKMLSMMGAIYITPGPFSIFKREVFTQLGDYRKAHQTEDMELAMRMQSHGMKIGNAHTAVVHTSAPKTLKKLYVQRLRWTHGFIQNAIDYRFMFFKKEYGNLGMFILPLASISILATLYAAGIFLFSTVQGIITDIVKIQTIGFHFPVFSFHLDWFSVNTEFLAILSAIAFLATVVILLLSGKVAKGKMNFGLDTVYFLALYSLIAPIWLAKAVYNVIFSVTTNWR